MRATYRMADEAPLVDGGTVVLDTGETIDLSAILAVEGTRPETVLVHRIGGRYLIAARGFLRAYLLEGGRARDIPLGAAAREVAIKTPLASSCAKVSYDDKALFIGQSGKHSFNRCPDEEAR